MVHHSPSCLDRIYSTNQGSLVLEAMLPSNAADSPPWSGLQVNGARNSLAHREGSISLALHSKFPFSNEEAEVWGAGTFPGSHSHYVTERDFTLSEPQKNRTVSCWSQLHSHCPLLTQPGSPKLHDFQIEPKSLIHHNT